jgi:hypothetical protein
MVGLQDIDRNLPPLRNIELKLAGIDQKAYRKHGIAICDISEFD